MGDHSQLVTRLCALLTHNLVTHYEATHSLDAQSRHALQDDALS